MHGLPAAVDVRGREGGGKETRLASQEAEAFCRPISRTRRRCTTGHGRLPQASLE